MRSGFSMEVNEPCPYCRGTGHSGNLHDETCSECDGSRRLVIDITPEERERFRNDPKFYAMVGVLERLRNESGLTHADMVSALDLACVSLHENRHRSPRPIEPIEIPSSLAEFINRPNPPQEAAGNTFPRFNRRPEDTTFHLYVSGIENVKRDLSRVLGREARRTPVPRHRQGVAVTTKDAITLLEQLLDAEAIVRECEHVQRSSTLPTDSLRIRCGDNECWAHPADLKAIAERARDDIRAKLLEGGYRVPGAKP